MSIMSDRPILHVEGKNDLHTVAALLQRHGVDLSEAKRPLQIQVVENVATKAEGVEALLANMGDAVRTATDRPIGFVLDVDVKIADRWSAVRSRLIAVGLEPPAVCPPDGYVDRIPSYPHPRGVWMMPDCATDHGKLEHLLKTLVPGGDALWAHSETSTRKAKDLGARFSDTDFDKAWIHCWLSWQTEPGIPFGTVIIAEFLRHDSPEALALLRWLNRLFPSLDLRSV